MVSQTRARNKGTHPATAVMTETAKVKAGIKSAKPRNKRMTKDARIRELEARIAQLERPDDPHPSKEPLVGTRPFISYKYTLIDLSSFSVTAI